MLRASRKKRAASGTRVKKLPAWSSSLLKREASSGKLQKRPAWSWTLLKLPASRIWSEPLLYSILLREKEKEVGRLRSVQLEAAFFRSVALEADGFWSGKLQAARVWSGSLPKLILRSFPLPRAQSLFFASKPNCKYRVLRHVRASAHGKPHFLSFLSIGSNRLKRSVLFPGYQ